jgi:3-isopropylmalate dehydratase small subunit
MSQLIESCGFFCGDYVDTDVMAPGRYDPIEGEDELARIALIDYPCEKPLVNPTTGRADVSIIVAGQEFGCGSSRETATLALFHTGIRVIIAKSFARIFFRNCINMGGLYPIQLEHNFTPSETDPLKVDLNARSVEYQGQVLQYADFGPLNEIIAAGGLAEYTKNQLR